MNEKIFARVLLMPDGSIHIALMNKQTYYCTSDSLLILLTDPENFNLKKYGQLDTSTYLINKNQDEIENIRGLTLLTITTDAKISCDFPILFQVFLWNYTDPIKTKSPLHITIDMLYEGATRYNNSAIWLYFEYYQKFDAAKRINTNRIEIGSKPDVKILSEILNIPDYKMSKSINFDNKPNNEAVASPEKKINPPPVATETTKESHRNSVDEKYVTVAEFAQIHGYKKSTVSSWVWRGKLKSAYFDDKNRCYIEITDKVTDGRAGRTTHPLADGRRHVHLKSEDYKDLQTYIKERNLVTDNIRPFIRKKEEIKYYETHNYHEVAWKTRNALIIDINPDWYSKKHKKTNRELIADNKSPVVPGKEDCEFVLHHIGQNKESPFAIIPGCDHGDEKWFSVFHDGKTCDDELHGSEFEKQKKLFWSEYMEQYDQNGGYRRIAYLNPKHKRRTIK